MDKIIDKTLDVVENVLNAAIRIFFKVKRKCRENKRKIHKVSTVLVFLFFPIFALETMYVYNVTVCIDVGYIVIASIMALILTVFGKSAD